MILRRLRTGAIGALCIASAAGVHAQEPSLAEQAAALRHADVRPLQAAVKGAVINNDYVNEYFGFTIRPFAGWESMGPGQMNVNEAIGRDAMGLSAGIDGSASGRVFGMHDLRGTSVIVTVRPIPTGADVSNLGARMREAVTKEIPTLKCADESTTIGDAAHKFVAFRCTNTIADRVFYQDQQAVVARNHVIALTLTAPTEERLNALMRQLKTSLVWTDPTR